MRVSFRITSNSVARYLVKPSLISLGFVFAGGIMRRVPKSELIDVDEDVLD